MRRRCDFRTSGQGRWLGQVLTKRSADDERYIWAVVALGAKSAAS